ncbi:MAG: hypothetical protein IT531_24680, partial [Burkholderiales bacterium]|nr:hypothetical protein [Burkholderiales bacterium]
LIKRDGDFEDHIPMGHGGQDPLRQKAPGLGNIISSPGALAFMGRDLVRTDAPVITVIGTDAQRRTTAVGEIPVSQLDTPKKRQWTMRRWALHTGSVNLFAVGAAEHSSTLLALGRDKLVMDAVHYVPDARLDQPKAISAAENRLFEGGNEGIYPANRRTRGTSDTSPMFADMRPGPAARRQQQGVSEPDFVQAPDGSPDFGEITPEMGRAMRRQAGPIRLERGEHRSDGTGHGLVHIEAGHGRQIRNAGYASVQDFVATVSRGFTRVYQTRARQLLLARVNGQQDVLFIQLEPTTEGGDYYRVNTAFPASRNYLEKQLERGAVLLWDGSEPTSAAAGQQPPYAGTPESSPDQGVPIARGESNGDSLPQGPDRVESPQTPYNTTPRRAQRTIGADGLSPAIHTYLASQRTAIPDRKTVGHVNYDKINSPEAVKLELAKLSDAYETQIAVARRGRVSVDATARLADLLGQSPARMAKLVRRKTSEASNAHELVARASLLEGSAEHLAKLMDEVAKNPTEENARAMIAQVERSAMMSAQFLGAAAEAGRALNILRNLNTATRQAERLRETADLIKDWGGLDNIRELAQRIQEYDTPQQLLGFAREQARSQAPSMWLEAWKAGLLSGPTTHLANILSNTITLGLRIPEKAITAMIGMAHGGEKAYMTEALAETLGMVMGVRSAARAAWHTFKTGDTAAEDKTEVRGKAITGANLGLTGGAAKAADLVGETVRIPFRFLSTEDAFFKELHRQMTLYALATRAAIAEKSKKPFQRIAELAHDENDPIRERADQDALYFTFNKRLGLASETFMRLVNTPGARWMQLIVPFIRTPTNIIKFAGERTPFAVLSKNVRNDLAAGGVARDEAIAKMVVGSALGLTAFSFAMEGLLSGGGPPEPERKRLLRERGWQPYSIKVGDTWHAYNRLEPLGILLGVAADGAEIWDYLEEDEREKLGAMIGIAVAQNLTSKTWLRGISDVVNALSNPGRYGDRYIANLAGTLIPTGLAQAARANDPIVRETEGMDAGGDPILREAADIIAKWKSRIPGMSEELQPRLDTWGEPVQREGGLGGAFSPIAVSREKADPVRDEAVRLKLEIKLPEKKLYDVKLSPEQRTMYGTLSGQTAHQVLSQVVTSDGYQRLPDWAKREMVSEIVSEVRSGAREIMMPEIGPETIVEKRLKRYEARP